MNNRTDVIGVSVKERAKQMTKTYGTLIEGVLSMILGFATSNSYIFSGLSPFGVAYVAASKYTIMSSLGAIMGYIFSGNPAGNIKYIAMVVMLVSIKWFIGSKMEEKIWIAPICTFAAMLVADTVMAVMIGYTGYDMLLAFAEILLGAGATYFFSRTFLALANGIHITNKADMSCIIISFGVLIIAMTGITVLGLSLGRMTAVIVIMLCALYGGVTAGAVSGIVAGASMGLIGGPTVFLMGTYSLAGLLSGAFSPIGRFGVAIAFVSINGIAAAIAGDAVGVIYEAFIMSVVFMCIPGMFLSKLSVFKTSNLEDTSIKEILIKKLGDAATALKDISLTTQKVSDKLTLMCSNDISSVYSQLASKCCKRCGYKTKCWQTYYNETMAALGECMVSMKQNGIIKKEEMPIELAQRCCKIDEFCSVLNLEYKEYLSKEGTGRKISQVRSVVTDQFEGMAMLLDEINEELGEISMQDVKSAKKVKEYFLNKNVEINSNCYIDNYGRMTVQVVLPTYKLNRIDKIKTTLELSDILDIEFDMPEVIDSEHNSTMNFYEKSKYYIEYGASQIACNDNKLCGDSYEYSNQKGRSSIILSDGMGSGGNAAVDSAMATNLLSRLIQAGISFDAALKMVNSALLVKSGEESLATIDVAAIDLYTGRVNFYKAGAAPTFVLKSGKAGYIESTSLPAGILRGVSFEKGCITLKEEDIILMVSDGVIATGVDWVKSELEHFSSGQQLNILAEKLANAAKLRRVDGREDDITVVAARIKQTQ